MSEHLAPEIPEPPPSPESGVRSPEVRQTPDSGLPSADEPADDESFERPPTRPVGAIMTALLVQVFLAAISILLAVYVWWVIGRQGHLARIHWFILGFIGLLFLRQLWAIRRLLGRLGRPAEEEEE